MINLIIKQSWLEESSETALEEFKSVLAEVLNSFPSDRHVEGRWSVSKISEGDVSELVYDERSLASIAIREKSLQVEAYEAEIPRYDDILYAVRYAASKLGLAVYSNSHKGARLPQDYRLSIDHSLFRRNKDLAGFFATTDYIPRFAPAGMEEAGNGKSALVVYAPYYAENKQDGSIHILNNPMINFLIQKESQGVSPEFSYKVADSMQDFARKYDLGLVPNSFYQCYGLTTKVINDTYFDALHIDRKVFVDPYVWDFDDEHEQRYYRNVANGMHLMDKVRKGEDLDTALRRVLQEELQVADDYVGAKIWGIEFDRDREGILTPRLKINVFVHGMNQKRRSQTHDWVSLR